MQIYNSLSGKKEEFKPIKAGEVKMYVCGVTVYAPLHLGHARSYVAYDVIKSYFEVFKNFKVFYVRNITDVGSVVGDADRGEDKIEKKAKELNKHPMQVVDENIKDMWENLDALKCARPAISPRATGHIVEIIEAVQKMIKEGYAYEQDGDVYCDVSKIKNYGVLSNNTLQALNAGARISVNEKKKSPFDFSVWKKADKNTQLKWNSPWGEGFPGWHIECSIMSNKYLGQTFDIHGGGLELRFPHHENEIAQNMALCGCMPANYFVHTGMLNIAGQKMSKSLGNYITVSDAIKKYGKSKLRWFLLNAQYSAPVNLSDESINAAFSGLERINNFFFNLNLNINHCYNKTLSELTIKLAKDFEKHMDDDFNTPNAIAAVYDYIRAANSIVATKCYNADNVNEILGLFKKTDNVFKCFKFLNSSGDDESDGKVLRVKELIEERNEWRQKKNFEKADEIKALIISMGVELFDHKDGTTTFKLSDK